MSECHAVGMRKKPVPLPAGTISVIGYVDEMVTVLIRF
jgi:hypothetical protein